MWGDKERMLFRQEIKFWILRNDSQPNFSKAQKFGLTWNSTWQFHFQCFSHNLQIWRLPESFRFRPLSLTQALLSKSFPIHFALCEQSPEIQFKVCNFWFDLPQLSKWSNLFQWGLQIAFNFGPVSTNSKICHLHSLKHKKVALCWEHNRLEATDIAPILYQIWMVLSFESLIFKQKADLI